MSFHYDESSDDSEVVTHQDALAHKPNTGPGYDNREGDPTKEAQVSMKLRHDSNGIHDMARQTTGRPNLYPPAAGTLANVLKADILYTDKKGQPSDGVFGYVKSALGGQGQDLVTLDDTEMQVHSLMNRLTPIALANASNDVAQYPDNIILGNIFGKFKILTPQNPGVGDKMQAIVPTPAQAASMAAQNGGRVTMQWVKYDSKLGATRLLASIAHYIRDPNSWIAAMDSALVETNTEIAVVHGIVRYSLSCGVMMVDTLLQERLIVPAMATTGDAQQLGAYGGVIGNISAHQKANKLSASFFPPGSIMNFDATAQGAGRIVHPAPCGYKWDFSNSNYTIAIKNFSTCLAAGLGLLENTKMTSVNKLFASLDVQGNPKNVQFDRETMRQFLELKENHTRKLFIRGLTNKTLNDAWGYVRGHEEVLGLDMKTKQYTNSPNGEMTYLQFEMITQLFSAFSDFHQKNCDTQATILELGGDGYRHALIHFKK